MNSRETLTLYQKLEAQRRKSNRPPACLISDLDDTFIMKFWPKEEVLTKYTQKFTDTLLFPDISQYHDSVILKKYLDENDIPLILVSGRDMLQMNELKNAFAQLSPEISGLLQSDGFIGAVGTEIYLRENDGTYRADTEYQKLLQETGFDREKIHLALEQLEKEIREKYKPRAYGFSKRDRIESKDELATLKYKLSIEYICGEDISEQIYRRIGETLAHLGETKIHFLLSSPYALDANERKYNVDIVPLSKDVPIRYLREKWNFQAIVAGDSGNDTDMLVRAADFAIVVGNAKPELIENLAKADKSAHIIRSAPQYAGPASVYHELKNIYENPDR